MEKLQYDKVVVESATVAAAQTEHELKINGSPSYSKLVGVMLLSHNEDGTLFTNGVNMSVVERGTGEAILPLQPFDAFRPSFAEKPADRIIPVNVDASNADFRFRFEAPALAANIKFTAIAYFTKRER